MRITIATAVVALTLGLAAAPGAQAPAPAAARPAAAVPGSAEAGKKLWVSYGCWQCHGYEAQGGAAGPRLAARNLSLVYFSGYVRRPTNQMPPYTEKVVSNEDLANLHTFVQSRPAPPAAASVPLLQK
jgi:ubiquinol-cytochrome c reductase cytochrome c subunit